MAVSGVYRSMFDMDGLPSVGDTDNLLGVRPHRDITADANGDVHPGKEGMSVTPDWTRLPPMLIPERLRPLVPAARGKDTLNIWRLKGVVFEDGRVGQSLMLTVTRPKHGVVGPALRMPLAALQESLANTRQDWELDEGSP